MEYIRTHTNYTTRVEWIHLCISKIHYKSLQLSTMSSSSLDWSHDNFVGLLQSEFQVNPSIFERIKTSSREAPLDSFLKNTAKEKITQIDVSCAKVFSS